MKKIVLSILFNAIVVLAFAQQKVEKFEIEGQTYFGTKAIPDEILGRYSYSKDSEKEPIVDVQKEGPGLFQVHDVKAYPAEFWVQTDEKGIVQMRKGEGNPNYQVVLILKYGSNGETGWRGAKAGTYDRIEATVAKDMGYSIILGERFKSLK